LVFTLFHGQNRITSVPNHWIPFTEYQVAARDNFDSHFMTDFIAGKAQSNIVSEPLLFYDNDSGGGSGSQCYTNQPRQFAPEAQAVFDAGRALWRYYHTSPSTSFHKEGEKEVNASLYEIREYFQGRDEKGKMNNKSDDTRYTELIADLRDKIKTLAKKIEPKVYEYGFLKA
jgi:hypothetical protein